jgi:ketosteroid isomerase-like protein
MIAADDVARVKRAYAGILAGDIETFLADFDADSLLIEVASLPYGGVHRGREACLAALAGIGAVWRNVHYEIADYAIGTGKVIACGTFTASARASGVAVSQPLLEIWTLAGGRVVSLEAIYGDTATLLAALR